MGFLEQVKATRRSLTARKRAWPVGQGALTTGETRLGHDQSEFSPEEYGEYAATSNEIFSVIQLRARLMSALELRFYRGTETEKKAMPNSAPAQLMSYVNPYWTARRLARMDSLSMDLWGESFWAVEKRGGQPAEIWWLKPSRVRPVPHESGYLQGYVYQSSTGQAIPFSPDEIVWFRYPNPIDEFSPLSPLAAARLPADTAKAMMVSNKNLFANGLQLGGVITPSTDKVSFTQDQAEDLSAMLDKRFKGEDKAHKWAVLRFEASIKAMNVTPKDAEFLAGINMTLRQICNAYGIPSPLMNDLEYATLSNIRDLMRGLWENTLVSDSQLRADEIREQFLPMFTGRGGPDNCEFDYSRVPSLQESATDAWGRERQAIEVGLLTINEVRTQRGLPPVPWGDVYWAQVNRTPVDGPEMDVGGVQPQEEDEAPAVVPDTPPADLAVEGEEEENGRGGRLSSSSILHELARMPVGLNGKRFS